MICVLLDFEVFRYDTLLGALIIAEDKLIKYQTWDLSAMQKFYEVHANSIWIGHNNIGYDNVILETIVNNKNPYTMSKKIINAQMRPKCHLPIITHDTMRGFYSLKTTELISGKNISETPIDFDLDRPLTEDEKRQVEEYNFDDLSQTYDNFIAQLDDFSIRIDIIKEFKLSMNVLNVSGTKLAAIVLGAHAIENIEDKVVPTVLPKNLIIKNQIVIDFYLNEDFRKHKSIKVTLCGCEHVVAAGGIHAALKKIHVDKALYFDVSGYYNLVMINYDLLPRTMPKESREKYTYMYHEQLRLKKSNPRKRAVYKTILLSVFGAMLNKYTDFYDPYNGSLVTITGELFLIDLLEKLEGKGRIIQSNTDGLMFEPYDWAWDSEEEIIKIVEEWESRTGFVIKKEIITNLWQRDVNNYFFDKDGSPVVKGEAVSAYAKTVNPIWCQLWNAKEPAIIAKGIVDYFLYNITPEETVEKNKTNLILYQYACKTLSFDYSMYEVTHADGTITKERLQHINRAFPSNQVDIGTIIKYKQDGNKIKKAKVQNLPPNVFVYNDDIRDTAVIEELIKKIDFDYYVNRIYERCAEFVDLST